MIDSGMAGSNVVEDWRILGYLWRQDSGRTGLEAGEGRGRGGWRTERRRSRGSWSY